MNALVDCWFRIIAGDDLEEGSGFRFAAWPRSTKFIFHARSPSRCARNRFMHRTMNA